MESTANHQPRILILGANGSIGSLVFEALRKEFPQAEILACVRKRHLHFEGVAGNRRQHSVIFDALHDDWTQFGRIDRIVNCIGAIDEREMNFETVHIVPLMRLREHFDALGRPQLIQVSALGARPDSPSAFLRTKSIADSIALQLPGSYVIRPSVVCTSGTMLVRRMLALKRLASFCRGRILFPQQFLRTEIQPVLPVDIQAQVVRLMKEGSSERVLDLGGPERFSLGELLCLAGMRPVPLRLRLAGVFLRVFSVLFQNRITKEQMILLARHNVLSPGQEACRHSTLAFFRKELSGK